MADLSRTYQGALSRGRIFGRPFTRGTPLVVSSDEAALLDTDPEWSEPKASKKAADPKSQGTTPTSKEP